MKQYWYKDERLWSGSGNPERDKFLTLKVFDKCWHEPIKPYTGGYDGNTCIHCGVNWAANKNIDFSSWEGFGMLFEHLKDNQEFWKNYSLKELINPDALANAVAEFYGFK